MPRGLDKLPLVTDVAPGAVGVQARAWRDGSLCTRWECVAEETPVALLYNGEPHAVMMATPLDLEDFAVGFSISERVIERPDELEACEIVGHVGDPGISYELSLRIPSVRQAELGRRRRNLLGRTGCGLCGAESLDEALRAPRRVGAGVPVHATALRRALDGLQAVQALNTATGATHAAAWAEPAGTIRLVREDVGRHNALDKLIGALLLQGIDTARGFALITSRASYEMALKAAMAGMPLLAAISAPTAYAIRVSEEAGLTLVGFMRGERFVIYTCPARVLEVASGLAGARE
jgi:FdhD protein